MIKAVGEPGGTNLFLYQDGEITDCMVVWFREGQEPVWACTAPEEVKQQFLDFLASSYGK